ncbi:NAD(P)H-dependent oxidoreductase [Streptomyces sp. NBC_00247]|uniref:NADPH-dependent FMN reductase n=1 Tax=Streptomyces sp. NBC_00247 TaxID=2975689 RepID=UPI002E29F14D|nr:NAD(P)H-dependent oxidoreductase [Streptomyces sp. NBC_00247]
MIRIAVVVGSVRPGRVTRAVADWAHTVAAGRPDARYEVVDLADHDLAFDEEAHPPRSGRYEHAHTRRWAATVAEFDGFLFVTPEYNHSAPAVLKNALDHLYEEWNDKAAGFVGLGFAGGVRAAEHLRGVAAELQLATVQAQLALNLSDDFAEYPAFAPIGTREKELVRVLDQLERWAGALKTLRG